MLTIQEENEVVASWLYYRSCTPPLLIHFENYLCEAKYLPWGHMESEKCRAPFDSLWQVLLLKTGIGKTQARASTENRLRYHDKPAGIVALTMKIVKFDLLHIHRQPCVLRAHTPSLVTSRQGHPDQGNTSSLTK